MSDTYGNPVVEHFGMPQQAARNRGIGWLEANPDDAARAMELEESSGVSAAVINGDLPNFEQQHKAKLAGQIIGGNQYIQDYINSHPLAAQVSNDDWGQLDATSGALQWAANPIAGKIAPSIMVAAVKGFAEGFGEQNIGSWAYDPKLDYTNPVHRAGWAAWKFLGAVPEIGLRTLSGLIHGATKAAVAGAETTAEAAGADPSTAARLGRDAGGMMEMFTANPLHLKQAAGLPEVVKKIQEVKEAVDVAKPWLEQGIDPPYGLHPLIDEQLKKQSDVDLKNLDNAFKEAQKSATRERSPEIFKAFIARHTDASIGIRGDRVAELYGDKLPTPDDNLLGWVPGITEQLEIARATGGDVTVPLADWLAEVEPEVYREVKDDIRVRKGGVTKTEVQERSEIEKVLQEAKEEEVQYDVMPAPAEGWHGSPYVYDKVDLSKARTGEGAAAYGEGHYIAENPEVAETYKEGRGYVPKNQKEVEAIQALRESNGNITKAIAQLEADSSRFIPGTSRHREMRGARKLLLSGWTEPKVEGNVYRMKVNAEKEHFLDWDRPLEEQDPHVQEAIAELIKKYPQVGARIKPGMVGADIYGAVARGVTHTSGKSYGDVGLKADTEASKALFEVGIPGNKFLDQFSRHGADLITSLERQIQTEKNFVKAYTEMGDGPKLLEAQEKLAALTKELADVNATHNFVVFDDSIIEITHRNGEAINAVRKAGGLEPLLAKPPKGWERAEPGFQPVSIIPEFAEQGKGSVISPNGHTATPLYSYTFKEGWEYLDQSKLGSLAKPIYNFFGAKLVENIGQIPVKVVSDQDMVALFKGTSLGKKREETKKSIPAFYDPVNHEIVLSETTALGKMGEGFAHTVMLHEGLHAFTTRTLINDKAMDLKVRAVMTEVEGMFKQMGPEGEKLRERFNYAFSNTHEFMAEVSNKGLQPILATLPMSEALAKRLGYKKRPENMWDAVREIIKDLFERLAGIRPSETILDGIFELGKQFEEIGQEKGTFKRKAGEVYAAEGQPELPQAGTTRIEDRELFSKASAIGMTVDQYKRYMKKIEQRQVEDAEAIAKIALREEQKHQTKEWKANRAKLRSEVEDTLPNRPDLSADRLLRDSVLYGDKLETKIRLTASALDEEQRAALPKGYVAENGIHPDDLAGLFGLKDGKELVGQLIAVVKDREKAGMTPLMYQRRMVEIETDRLMEAKYGNLERNILEEAKEHVLSETQLDLLHEEVLALGMKHGGELSLTKEQLQVWMRDKFSQIRAEDVSSDKYLAEAGRAGKAAEMGLLKDDFALAFKEKQRQWHAVTMAREAKKLEKEQAQFERRAKRYREDTVTGVDQEYVNFVHDLLQKAGLPVKRGREVPGDIIRDGNTTLDAFVDAKQADGWELDVTDAIRQGQIKPIEQMTVQEFRDFKDAVDTLHHVGRAEKQIVIAGEKADFAEWKAEVLENITELPYRAKEKQGKLLFKADAALTRIEQVVKDLDLRKQLGPLFRALIEPMMSAKHKEYLLQEKLSKELGKMREGGKAWQKTLGDTIPNDFFLDPHTGIPFDMTRSNLLNIMLNWGNKSNRDKFTKGWVGKKEAPAFEQRMTQLIHQHATKEDWDFVQKIGDIFQSWQVETDVLYHNLSGLAPKKVQIEPMQTPHGEYRGWYFPIIYDKFYSNIDNIKRQKGGDLLGFNYFKATTGNGHTKERSGYVDRVEFQNSVDQLGSRMQQVMHDISYRAAVMQGRKIVSDKAISSAIKQHYGMEYEAQLEPWLKDIANHFNQNEVQNDFMNSVMRRARMNLAAHALGLNLKVIGSPDVGSLNPAAVARVLSNYGESMDLAYSKSKEIPHTYQNMDRDFREGLEHLIKTNKWDQFQADAVRWAFIPLVKVSQGFRVVTFVDQYKKALAKGMTENDAAALADSEVRLRHGATGIPDLPAVMRGSEGMKMATMFYGFFNAMYNWQRNIPGQMKRGEFMGALETTYGAVIIPALFGALLFNKADKDEGWGKTMAKAFALQLTGTLPFVRELGSAMIEGQRGGTPIASLFQALASAYTDGKHYLKGEKVNKPVTHAANVIGLGLGLPMAQIGRTGQFAADVYQGKQRPKNILEWVKGTIHGEIKPKR